MKASQIIVVLVVALAGHAKAVFQGTDEEFMNIIADGKIPDTIGPETKDSSSSEQRRLRAPRLAGQRCGRNTPCVEGLDCVRAGIGRQCLPTTCVAGAIERFVERHSLQNYPQTIMEGTGFAGKMVMNETYSKQGWKAVASNTKNLLRTDFRDSLVDTMKANEPPMGELLIDVLQECPEAASRTGITIMLGLHYELAAVVPKWYNNFYFAVGTADLNLNVGNTSSGTPTFDFNVTSGIFTDCCAGVGPDVGAEFGLTGGLALSGTVADLTQCGFMFDIDAGVGSSFGLAAGVTSLNVAKFMVTQSLGLGAGIGFSGCGTLKISDIIIG